MKALYQKAENAFYLESVNNSFENNNASGADNYAKLGTQNSVVKKNLNANANTPELVDLFTLDFPLTKPGTSKTITVKISGVSKTSYLNIATSLYIADTKWTAVATDNNSVAVTFINASSIPQNPAKGTFIILKRKPSL